MAKNKKKHQVEEKKPIGLVTGIVHQLRDDSLMNGTQIIQHMSPENRQQIVILAAKALTDLSSMNKAYSASGKAGETLNDLAPQVLGSRNILIPSFALPNSSEVDYEVLAAALLSDDFGIALRQFEKSLRGSDLEKKYKTIKEFCSIDWKRFSPTDLNFLANTYSLVKAGRERQKLDSLQLESFVPLTKIPAVLANIKQACVWGELMAGALNVYIQQREFIKGLSEDNDGTIAQLDSLLAVINASDQGFQKTFEEIGPATNDLKELMDPNGLVARSVKQTELSAKQNEAAIRLSKALKAHNEYTLEREEALAQHFLELDSILSSDALYKGHMAKAKAALSLYSLTYRGFSLQLIGVRTFLLIASAVIMMKTGEALANSSRVLEPSGDYHDQVSGVVQLHKRFLTGFYRIPDGKSLAVRPSRTVSTIPIDANSIDAEIAMLG